MSPPTARTDAMITNITDRERTQAAVILALESARDEMSARIEALERKAEYEW